MKNSNHEEMSEELNEIGRTLVGAIEAQALRENGPPPDPNDLAALLDGNLEGEERDRVIEQALRSPSALSILKGGIPEEEGLAEPVNNIVRPSFFQRFKPTPALAALAAGLILAIVIFYRPQSQQNKAFVPFETEIRNLVLEGEMSWSAPADLASWRNAFSEHGVTFDEGAFNRVILEEEYFMAKSFGDKKEEELVFHLENGVLYVKVRTKSEGSEQEH